MLGESVWQHVGILDGAEVVAICDLLGLVPQELLMNGDRLARWIRCPSAATSQIPTRKADVIS